MRLPLKQTALSLFATEYHAAKCARYSSAPAAYVPFTKFSDKTANGLTKCIIEKIKLDGGFAERITNTGRVIDRRQKIVDPLGRTRIIGSMDYIPGTGTNGTADVSSVIKGRSVKIEVKIGRDTQSDDQKAYQQSIEAAGGIYIIARSFADFLQQYQLIF